MDKKRYLYVYRFNDGAVYVGLTYDTCKRRAGHRTRGTISAKLKSMKFKFWSSRRAYDVRHVAKWEKKLIHYYQSAGADILNKYRGGSVGHRKLHTLEDCQREALKFNERNRFCETSPSFYSAARRLKCLDQVCSHMKPVYRPKPLDDWTIEELIAEALRYKTRTDFYDGSRRAYLAAMKRGLLKIVCAHLPTKCQNNASEFGRRQKKVESMAISTKQGSP